MSPAAADAATDAAKEAANGIVDYFKPSKSHYYIVAICSFVGLALVCDVTDDLLWLVLALPTYALAASMLVLSLGAKNTMKKEEHDEQLRFARGVSLGVAVLALTFVGSSIYTEAHRYEQSHEQEVTWPAQSGEPSIKVDLSAAGRVLAAPHDSDFLPQTGFLPKSWFSSRTLLWRGNFWANFVLCALQLLLFLLYSLALNRRSFGHRERNYVQLTLLSSGFLADTSYNLMQGAKPEDVGWVHHEATAAALSILWLAGFAFWVRTAFRLGLFGSLRNHRPSAPAAAALPAPAGPSPGG